MTSEQLRTRLEPFVRRTGGLMYALNNILEEHGYIDLSLIPEIANIFNLSQAEVRGVVSFYHDFKTKPPATNRVRICQAEACQAQGARQLTREVENKYNVKLGKRTADDHIDLEAVYCLGLCALGPSMQINGKIIGRANVDSLKELDS